jgi:hypothetical protein
MGRNSKKTSPERSPWQRAFGTVLLLVLSFAAIGMSPALAMDKHRGSTVICHAPESPKNPYVTIVVPSGKAHGHEHHVDDIFDPADKVCPKSRFTFHIDKHLKPNRPAVPGLNHGPARPVGVTVGPDGKRDEFVVNEVVLQPSNEADLFSFLDKYDGVVLRDGTPMLVTAKGVSKAPPKTSSGAFLIRVDLSRSPLGDISRNMTANGITGAHLFSSENAARLAALLAREKSTRQVSPNMVATPAACTVCEHPDGAGGNIDAATFPWMTEDNDPATAGDQGLSIGVIRAWDYLAYMGLPPPPPGGTFITPVIAIIDDGFALDPTTGVPLSGNLDYGLTALSRPLQIDVVDGDGTAGGSGSGWHGQMVFGVAAARPKNLFGWAGTGGEVVKPMLIRFDATFTGMADAVRAAALSGASVINMSWGGECNWLCRGYSGGDRLQADLGFAANLGVINVASAGNDGVSSEDLPCKLNRVLCVGGTTDNGQAHPRSNFGANVDIWAPFRVRTTVAPVCLGPTTATPSGAACDSDNVGLDELPLFPGTSAASPFVAGIVGLMKALDRSIEDDRVQQILQATVNTSATTVGTVADPKVTPGWVDAFRAVNAVRPNQPPTVKITQDTGLSTPQRPFIRADAHDPEPGGALPGAVVVRFSSDRDGDLCVVNAPPFFCNALLSFGTHVLTATATDPFGAQGRASLTLLVENLLPTATITSPVSDIRVSTSQFVNFQGQGSDPEGGPVSLAWQSSLSGPLGTGNSINVQLPAGEHVVTLTVTDANGATAQDSVVVTVVRGEGQPTAQILAPPANANFVSGVPIRFEGKGTDPEDGVLQGSALRWSSNIDGFLGTGATLDAVLLSPTVCNDTIRQHMITLEATDSDGNVGVHQIAVTVGCIR